MIVINLVTPKAAAKQELLFNKPASEAGFVEHLSWTSVAQQSVTKYIIIVINLVTPKAQA
jgi:hypothetical protein